jgi:Asp-tRNA(Asn)/Glu-tRNA(Gln) amidotransferase A subunit family amidase
MVIAQGGQTLNPTDAKYLTLEVRSGSGAAVAANYAAAAVGTETQAP